MLHSEDADINKVIRQIIELDSRAVRIKNNVVTRGEEILEQTKEKIKKTEQLEIENAQLVAKENYRTQIEQAEKEREMIVTAMKEDIQKYYNHYNEKKDEKALEVIETLFNRSVNQ